MKKSKRTFISIILFPISFYFFAKIFFPTISPIEFTKKAIIIFSIIGAIMICSFVWLFLGGFTKNMLQKTFFTGVIIGCITFGLGFFGPMIIAPEANQGPLLGILITGPLGFILGLIGGGFYWYFKLRNHSKS